ncbi:hypothetical protein N0V90_005879 [Kalmusia sp. IMI 367209]|nr:hypothetical protein N0V90_005879 [Kalmusia sp. IMI 367209]
MVAAQTVRRWILTGSVAAITVTGALYGAGLKQQYEVKQILELSTEERIAQLEAIKQNLRRTKDELERKMENTLARRRGEEVGEGNRRSNR